MTKKIKIKQNSFFSFGTKVLLFSHSLFWFGGNLVLPALSIFFVNELHGVTVTEIGISTLIFFLSFGLLEPLVGFVADRIPGVKDEIIFIAFGYIARGILFMLFALSSHVWHLYMFQFLLGSFRAIAGPADKVLYARYLQGKHSATLWGIDESLINIFSACGAGLGGYLISFLGFRVMFVITGIITVAAGVITLPLIQYLRHKRSWINWIFG